MVTAGETGETLGAATARNQTELDFGHAHAAVLGDHAKVGRNRDFEAAAERKAVDGRDRDLRKVLQGEKRVVEHVRELLRRLGREARELGDVGAGCEVLSATGDHHGPGGVVDGSSSQIACRSRIMSLLSALTFGRSRRMTATPSATCFSRWMFSPMPGKLAQVEPSLVVAAQPEISG